MRRSYLRIVGVLLVVSACSILLSNVSRARVTRPEIQLGIDHNLAPALSRAASDIAELTSVSNPAPIDLAQTSDLSPVSPVRLTKDWTWRQLVALQWMHPRFSLIPQWCIGLVEVFLLTVLALIVLYTLRHVIFTMNRLFADQRHPFLDIDTAEWPRVTVLIAAHNEESVIMHSIAALLDADYPHNRIRIVPVNDRSTDGTRDIIDGFAIKHPDRVFPFHRSEGRPGKAAALKDATENLDGEIVLVFDADYIPGRGLIKQLVAPFFDPETGAVMGRVVPLNVGKNLLTRLLDMERAGGYQVDQQARMNLATVPQYGGTVGGVRISALREVGGWRDDALAEDTDLTYRLLLNGWKTVYQNRSECYEEVPECWPVRVRQIMRWARGHNQAAFRYIMPLLGSRNVSGRERLDGLMLLGVYVMSPLLFSAWAVTLFLFYFSTATWLIGSLALFALMSYAAVGNFAAFFEIGAAAYLDGSQRRIRLLPLNLFGFLISIVTITRASTFQLFDAVFRRKLSWDKTARYRATSFTI